MKLMAPAVVEIPEEQHPQGEEVDVQGRDVLRSRQGHVVEPSRVGGDPQREADVEEDSRSREEPVTHRVHPGKGHVPGSDHERPDVVAEARQDRQGEEEEHGHAVHGEELVEQLRRHHPRLRVTQLDPHDEGFDPAEDQEHESRDEVADADDLVVHGGQGPDGARRGLPDPFESVQGGGGKAHRKRSRNATISSREAPSRPVEGINTPGFTADGSASHRAMLSGVLGRIPAARVARPPT